MKLIPRLLLAALIAVGGAATAPAAAAAQSAPTPGAVLATAPATLPAELAPLATGRRIQYVTTNVHGASIPATGLILTPRTGKKNKTVVWGHGSTGLADRCAPSVNQNVFWSEARAAVAELLRRGWTVTAPDFPGLGTPQPHPYLVGESEGRSMIDSVKAARRLDPALSVQYATDGHSQGGQASLFANQLAPGYDGSLVLKGSAAIAPASNLDLLAPGIPGTPGQGYLVMALYGLAAVEPGFHPYSVLAAPAEQRTPVLANGCLLEILDTYAAFTPEQLVEGGVVPPAVVAKLGQYGNPAQTPTSAPILIVQGTADQDVPFEITAGPLLDQLGAYPQPVTFVPIEGGTHDSSVVSSTVTVANWIAARFG